MKPKLSKILSKKFDPSKKYKVYIEMSGRNTYGYIFMHPKDVNEKSTGNFFILTFYFKKIGDKRNPIFIVDRLEGMNFDDRIEVINHFSKHNALTYCVKQDGFEKL